MKKLLLSVCCLVLGATSLFAQKYITRTGKIKFDATTPKSPEKIEGVNNEVGAVLDGLTGDLVFQVFVKSFKFERDLMQQHFNENYMESDKFPKAEFKGKVSNINEINLKAESTFNVSVAGKLTIHGVTMDIVCPGTIVTKGKNATISAKLIIELEKYGIKIPGVVADKVAKEATLNIDAVLTQK